MKLSSIFFGVLAPTSSQKWGCVKVCFVIYTFCFFLPQVKSNIVADQEDLSDNEPLPRQRRFVEWTKGTVFQVLYGIGMPLNIPNRQFKHTIFVEGTYPIAQSFRKPPEGQNAMMSRRRSPRDVERRHTYNKLGSILDDKGFNGTECVLRTICEAAETPLHHHNGLIGELLHLILTPHHSDTDIMHIEAHHLGRRGEDCSKIYPGCRDGILDLVSIVNES